MNQVQKKAGMIIAGSGDSENVWKTEKELHRYLLRIMSDRLSDSNVFPTHM